MSIKVSSFDPKTGMKICTYNSVSEASRMCGGSGPNAIIVSCENENRTAYGYKWKFDEDSDIFRVKHSSPHSKVQIAVLSLDPETKEVLERFESLTAASLATGCSVSNIADVCKGYRRQTKGYIWAYEDERHLEKKFKKRCR